MSPRILAVLGLISFLVLSCGKSVHDEDTAVVALSGDVENFNPVVTSSYISAEVNSGIFPMMFDLSFDMGLGTLNFKPGLVKEWAFLNGGKDIILHLRSDVFWQDGVRVTADDVKFSYDLYGDPEVASPRSNYMDHMIFTDGEFDPDKSITIIDDSTVIFHFTHPYPQQLFHLNLSPIPKHVFRNADRRTLRSNPANQKPIAAGPFKLEKWIRQQELVLATNNRSTLPYPAKLGRIVMRVINEPTTRLTELKKGTVDLMWPILPEDVKEIQEKYPHIKLHTLPPRAYEYVGWANIDFEEYKKSNGKTIIPHKLFGDKLVRQALTFGIDRKGIVDAKYGEYAELATSDISPVFRWARRLNIIPYPYDPEKARQLLKQAGWTDTDGDGIIDKNGVKFEFTLMYNSGNSRREYAATFIQDNLKQLGIKVHLASAESVVFYENITQKKYDAFIAGFSVGLAIDPSNRWGDIKNPFNTAGFQHPRISSLITLGMNVANERDAAPFWKEIQSILHQEQPVTFMYWIKDIVGVNRRLKNTNINILGVMDGMWDWRIGDPNSYATF